MKKLHVIYIVCALFLSSSVYAQTQIVPLNESYYAKHYRQISSMYMYFDAGLSIPTKTFGAQPSADKPILAPFLGTDGMGAKTGYNLGVGFIFGLGKHFASGEKNVFYPTLGYYFTLVSNPVNWSSLGSNWADSFSIGSFTTGGGGISAGLAYNWQHRFVFEYQYKIALSFGTYFSGAQMDVALTDDDFYISKNSYGGTNPPLFVNSFSVRTGRYKFSYEFFKKRVKNQFVYDKGTTYSYIGGDEFNSDFLWTATRLTFSILILSYY